MPLRFFFSAAALCVAVTIPAAAWNPGLAAQYLDQREKEWLAWKPAQMPGGACLSCHTGMTYLMARPKLRQILGEAQPTEYEETVLDAIRRRVEVMEPGDLSPGFASSPIGKQAVGTEAVLSALLLISTESRPPSKELITAEPARAPLPEFAAKAFNRLWRLQISEGPDAGAFPWFTLNAEPFETKGTPFYAATLAALAVSKTPASYREKPLIHERIEKLSGYLRRTAEGQPLHHRIMLAWAAHELPGLLAPEKAQGWVDEALRLQGKDGGWTTTALGPWPEHPDAPQPLATDGYATAFLAFALQQCGVNRSEPHMAKALTWLRTNQNAEHGYWEALSINKSHPAQATPSKFMRDAATGFAVLALADGEIASNRRVVFASTPGLR